MSWREQYTPFGRSLNSPLSNNDRDGFTGHIKDSATGLTYMQARYYDPVIGRFLSIDPVGFSADNTGSFNRFAYVNNDPIGAIDPNGEETLEVIVKTPKGKGLGHVFVRLTDNNGGQISRGFYPDSAQIASSRSRAGFAWASGSTVPGEVRDDSDYAKAFDKVTGNASYGKGAEGEFESRSFEISTGQYDSAIDEIDAFKKEISPFDKSKNNGWGKPCHCGTFSQRVAGAAGQTIGTDAKSVRPKQLAKTFKQVRLGSRIPKEVK